MRCPRCGKDLGDDLVPARCPACGQTIMSLDGAGGTGKIRSRHAAEQAAGVRREVEGLSGVGLDRATIIHKRIVRLVAGIVLVFLFCTMIYVVAYQTELIGGRTIPNVTGWRKDRAAAELGRKGFATETHKEAHSDEASDMVVAQSPHAGMRVEPGSTVSLEVS